MLNIIIDFSKKINAAQLNPNMLVGRYMPTWLPSRLRSRKYMQLIYDRTSSSRLDKVLKKREQESWVSSGQRQKKLAYVNLVELLAYQFASPVRWIESQDYLFKDTKYEAQDDSIMVLTRHSLPRQEWQRNL